MILLKKIPFTFEDKKYEIRILFGNHTINIVAFYSNYPANGYRHQIILPKDVEPEKLLNTDSLKELMEISKNDIIERRWEKCLNFFKANNKELT